MNIFQKIKALLALDKAVTNIQEELKMKPGWKTTEFWMTVATNVITVVGALKGLIPDQSAALILAIANGIYGIARAIPKAASVVGTPPPATPV